METIAVWVSCGAASAVAAKITVKKYGETHNVRLLNNYIADEDADNQRFLRDVGEWCGRPIEFVASRKYPSQSCIDVWNARSAMSFPRGAPCTIELKKRARQEWEKENPVDYHVLGFTYDELQRHDRFVLTERSNVLPVLIDARMTKQDCFDMVLKAGLKLPAVYGKGFPNANCIGCVKATSPTYWNLVRKEYPDVFKARAEQSRRLGAKLARVKGVRIYLDELPLDARGRDLKEYDFECGLFCEEREF